MMNGKLLFFDGDHVSDFTNRLLLDDFMRNGIAARRVALAIKGFRPSGGRISFKRFDLSSRACSAYFAHAISHLARMTRHSANRGSHSRCGRIAMGDNICHVTTTSKPRTSAAIALQASRGEK
jgi:hypothetical protein